MNYLSLFAGIGGFDLALNRHGHQCIGYSEINKYAIAVYERHFPEVKNYGDITRIKDLPDLSYSAVASHASPIQPQATDEGLTTQEGSYSLTCAELLETKDPQLFCLKTSKDYLRTTKETLSASSLQRWRNWGIALNGKCITASISADPRTGKECSLWDILQDEVLSQYFQLEAQAQATLEYYKSQLPLTNAVDASIPQAASSPQ